MKQLLFACAVLLFACNDGTKVAGSNDDAHARNSESNQAVYKAIETGDVSKLDSFLTEDIVDYNGHPNGGDIRGRDSVKHFMSQIHTYFENLKIDVLSEGVSQDGNHHYSMVRMQGKAKENPWGMPVGMQMDDTMVDVVKLRDGKAAEHWGFMSMGDINEMMHGSGGDKPPVSDTTKKK
ncbi:MAG: nuclear transport factor 2 family protein [Flavisolibacter sp.]|jgi:ketosteroid isomerase-like protein|nr:nuclear transport factor 2 family protein [Flavisolibacter sp.]